MIKTVGKLILTLWMFAIIIGGSLSLGVMVSSLPIPFSVTMGLSLVLVGIGLFLFLMQKLWDLTPIARELLESMDLLDKKRNRY